jgi:hypothetical protein
MREKPNNAGETYMRTLLKANYTLYGLISLCLILCGCVERKLTIRTQPDDALVMLNDEELGKSPVTVHFQWYGDYNVRIQKEGYETLQTHKALTAPWYDYFPFDFMAQILNPNRIMDTYEWTFTLTPAATVDRDHVIQQALALEQALLTEAESEPR